MIDLLRSDKRPEILTLERVKRNWVDYEDDPLLPEILVVLTRVETDEESLLISSEPLHTTVQFLPSKYGAGYLGTFSGWFPNCENDGWPRGLAMHGVALPSQFDNIWTRTVVRRLSQQGVQFLSDEEADNYLRDKGDYWAWYHGRIADAPSLWKAVQWRTMKLKETLVDLIQTYRQG